MVNPNPHCLSDLEVGPEHECQEGANVIVPREHQWQFRALDLARDCQVDVVQD